MKFLKHLAFAAAVLTPGLILAGNIPQYTMKKVSTMDEDYPYLTDATVITQPDRKNFEPQMMIFADGTESVNGYTGPGFPIGFDFRFGGQEFDQFIVSSNGNIMLGKGNIKFSGHGGNGDLGNLPPLGLENPFQIAMAPIKGGAKRGTISYKTTGSEGDRILTVEFKEMKVEEPNTVSTLWGVYTLQIRLFEKDGKVELAFLNNKLPNSSSGFATGLHGWDSKDQIIAATVKGGKPDEVSIDSKLYTYTSEVADMLSPGSYINWNAYEEDLPYSFILRFTSASSGQAPAAAPTDLKLEQKGSELLVSCKKAEDADATVIVYSTQPFTETDTPVDGVSPRILGDDGLFCSKFGNATVIYYHNDAEPQVRIPNVDNMTTYYVRAYSVNGYPNYNLTATADATHATTQLPPKEFFATPGVEGVELTWNSQYPVIVAMTEEHPSIYKPNYVGVFGNPSANAVAGDEIEGGGKVIYTGDAASFLVDKESLRANYPAMFRIWNVNEGVVSATASDTYAIPVPSFPYEPAVEDWQQGIQLPGWSHSDDNAGFWPIVRDGAQDNAVVGFVQATPEGSAPVYISLTTPELPFEGASGKLSFEWALETIRDAAKPEGSEGTVAPDLPQGNEPGYFGTFDGAGLHIGFGALGNVRDIELIEEYNGTMENFTSTSYISGSSTWQPEEIELPSQAGNGVVSFRAAARKAGILYLRNIKIERNGSIVENIGIANNGVKVDAIQGGIRVAAGEAADVDVYNLLGVRVAAVALSAGETAVVELPSGIYIVDGKKMVVK